METSEIRTKDWSEELKGLIGKLVMVKIQRIEHTVVGDMDEGETEYTRVLSESERQVCLNQPLFEGSSLYGLSIKAGQGRDEVILSIYDPRLISHQPGWSLVTQYSRIGAIYDLEGREVFVQK